jgi:hypothetical protein
VPHQWRERATSYPAERAAVTQGVILITKLRLLHLIRLFISKPLSVLMDNWLEARFSVAVVIERKWYGFVLNTVKVLRRSDIEMDNWFEAKFSVAVVIEQMW